MQDAIGLVLSKQDEPWRWQQEENYFNGRMLTRLEMMEEVSKWVTMDVLKIMSPLY
jgi:hypothetical protein